MLVKFNRLFFGPNGFRYRPGIVYDIPDDWTLPTKKVGPPGPNQKTVDDFVRVDEKPLSPEEKKEAQERLRQVGVDSKYDGGNVDALDMPILKQTPAAGGIVSGDTTNVGKDDEDDLDTKSTKPASTQPGISKSVKPSGAKST